MKEIFIYGLKDPLTNDIRYVGKTIGLNRRYNAHIANSKIRKVHSSLWIKSLMNKGVKPELVLIETVNEENWIEREKYWISFYRKLYDLTNITDGGESNTNYARMGKKNSPEHIAKCVASRTGKSIIQTDKEGKRKKAIIDYYNKNKKLVYQYDLDGSFIQKWDCAVTAGKELHIAHSGITKCCKNLRKKAGNFIWSFEKNSKLECYNPDKKTKKVYQYDKQGTLLTEWSSVKEASIKTNISESTISNNLLNLSKTAGGYVWKYNY